MVHPRVYEALAKPIVGHLDPYFIQVMGEVQQLLKLAYGTIDGATLVISGTGSAGMEASVANFVAPETPSWQFLPMGIFPIASRRWRSARARTS